MEDILEKIIECSSILDGEYVREWYESGRKYDERVLKIAECVDGGVEFITSIMNGSSDSSEHENEDAYPSSDEIDRRIIEILEENGFCIAGLKEVECDYDNGILKIFSDKEYKFRTKKLDEFLGALSREMIRQRVGVGFARNS